MALGGAGDALLVDGCAQTAAAMRSVSVGLVSRCSAAAVGVNQWPRSQTVLTCSTGPSVDSQVHRSTMRAPAWQVASGQAITSDMVVFLLFAYLRGSLGGTMRACADSCLTVHLGE